MRRTSAQWRNGLWAKTSREVDILDDYAACEAELARVVAALQSLTVKTHDILRHDKEIVTHGGWEHDLGFPCDVCAALDAAVKGE